MPKQYFRKNIPLRSPFLKGACFTSKWDLDWYFFRKIEKR